MADTTRMATYDGSISQGKRLTAEELEAVYLYEGKLPEPKRGQTRTLRRFVARGGQLVEVEKIVRETRG